MFRLPRDKQGTRGFLFGSEITFPVIVRAETALQEPDALLTTTQGRRRRWSQFVVHAIKIRQRSQELKL
jgi:hypothetical protein